MIDQYSMGDNDQPTTCPKCGSRTDFLEAQAQQVHTWQVHTCLSRGCRYTFIMVAETDQLGETPAVENQGGSHE